MTEVKEIADEVGIIAAALKQPGDDGPMNLTGTDPVRAGCSPAPSGGHSAAAPGCWF